MPVTIDLRGKRAIVTGCGRGIGKIIAKRLAEAGAEIAANDIVAEWAQTTAYELKKDYDCPAIVLEGDISDKERVSEMSKKISDGWGRLDMLVNNAGIPMRKSLTELNEEDWDRTLDVNLKGMFLCSQAFSPFMVKNGGGRIVNIASTQGYIALPPRLAYSTSKGGVMSLTKELSAELARFNITVNAIGPGWIKTEMTRALLDDEKIGKKFLENTPMGRFGDPIDVANVVLFLCSDLATYITGQTIFVDGGETII